MIKVIKNPRGKETYYQADSYKLNYNISGNPTRIDLYRDGKVVTTLLNPVDVAEITVLSEGEEIIGLIKEFNAGKMVIDNKDIIKKFQTKENEK